MKASNGRREFATHRSAVLQTHGRSGGARIQQLLLGEEAVPQPILHDPEHHPDRVGQDVVVEVEGDTVAAAVGPRAVEGVERVAGGEADDISLGAAEEEVAARPPLEVESEVLRAAERQPFLRYLG